jgi:hypothetical protein
MKTKATIALAIVVVGFVSAITAIELPRKPKSEEKAYVLPLVEDMPRVANPLQF